MLELFFAGMTAFLHGAAMATAQGVDAKTFLPYAQDVLGVLHHSLDGLAADVDAGSYPGTEDNLAMELTALGHIVDTGAELGLDPRLPELLRDVTRGAAQAGHGGDGFSRVVEVLRAR
jgi:3-hydroxyisobutyrate dehydrogenase-like beta-hydroxyacid dehydrogenase